MIVIFTAVAVMAGYRFQGGASLSVEYGHPYFQEGFEHRQSGKISVTDQRRFSQHNDRALAIDDVLLSTYREIAGDPEMRRKVVFEFSRGPDAWSQYVVSNLRIRLGGEAKPKSECFKRFLYIDIRSGSASSSRTFGSVPDLF